MTQHHHVRAAVVFNDDSLRSGKFVGRYAPVGG
jgi:hypothetical protein